MGTPATDAVLRDANAVPQPQYYNPNTTVYETLYGQSGTIYAARPLDPNGYFAYTRLYGSTALESTGQIKNAPGLLSRLVLTNTTSGSTVVYLHLFNSTTAPVSGTTVPFECRIIPNSATSTIDLTSNGLYFNAGIYYAISSVAAVYTSTSITSAYLTYAYGA